MRKLAFAQIVIALVAIFALSFGVGIAQADSGWTYQGCWSPYPNGAGATDVYTDAQGRFWQCGACGTSSDPSPSTCTLSGDLNAIGYWLS
jgi:hypothetical protein